MLESKSLAYQKVYPDSTGSTDRVTFQYNRQRQAITMTDQAGTVHGYGFDMFGRGTEDAVSAFGTGVDQAVKKITRSYEVRGMLEKVSSFDTGSTPLNEVQLAYNDYSQLAKDYQSHSGAVNTGSTLNVAYAYESSGNTVRRIGITYPDNSPTITIAYDGTTADALSRPDALKEGGTTLCSYRYLGSGVVIGVKYDAASNIELTYEDGGTGDAGDQYTGLDRFGRLVETLWKKGGTDQVRSKYGRNRFGGVVWRRDVNAHAQSPAVDTEDNYYWYDALYQVKERQRGDLTGTAPDYTGISNLQQDEAWTYDASGNWQASSNTAPTSAQARINNTANEITLLSSAAGDITPAYDPAGNMTTLPQAPGTATAQYDLKWDAWNRLVEVKDGSTVVASYTYDGLTRRLTKANATETRHYYYDDQWRPVEERVNGNKERQYTWGLRDRWDLLRRILTSGSTHFCLRDYLDPVAIVGTDGEIKERYAYDAFGNVRFLAPDYSSRSASDFGWEFLFHAEFRDNDTKLYNYGYRYYDTGLGRWLSRDPIGERGGINLAMFAGNAPICTRDVCGLIRWGSFFSAVGQAVGAIAMFGAATVASGVLAVAAAAVGIVLVVQAIGNAVDALKECGNPVKEWTVKQFQKLGLDPSTGEKVYIAGEIVTGLISFVSAGKQTISILFRAQKTTTKSIETLRFAPFSRSVAYEVAYYKHLTEVSVFFRISIACGVGNDVYQFYASFKALEAALIPASDATEASPFTVPNPFPTAPDPILTDPSYVTPIR